MEWAGKDAAELTYVASFPLSHVADVCGVSEETVKDTAHVFIARQPSVAVVDGRTNSREAQAAVMILNILAGAVGKEGGIAVRREVPAEPRKSKSPAFIPADLSSIPDHSIRVMILDESLSGCPLSDSFIQKKLAAKGVIVSLSPFVTERSFSPQYVIPSPVFLESLTDLSGAYDREDSSLSISYPLVPAPVGVVDPIHFIQRLAGAAGIGNVDAGTTEELLKKRLGILSRENRGSVFNASNGQTSDGKNLVSPDELWKTMIAGGCWMDAVENATTMPAYRITAVLETLDVRTMNSRNDQLMLVPFVERATYSGLDISPLMSKVGQESELRHYGCRAYLNSKTADGYGIVEGCRLLLRLRMDRYKQKRP